MNTWKNLLIEYKMNENISITEGGRTRMESIISGINFLKNNNEISHDDIFISTDSVRPIVRKHEIQELIKKAQQFGASTIVTPIIENIVKINENDEIEEIFKREKFFKDLSPQAFNVKEFLNCLERINESQIDEITDLSELFIKNGKKVATIKGDTDNIKITTPIDIKIVNELIKKKEGK